MSKLHDPSKLLVTIGGNEWHPPKFITSDDNIEMRAYAFNSLIRHNPYPVVYGTLEDINPQVVRILTAKRLPRKLKKRLKKG